MNEIAIEATHPRISADPLYHTPKTENRHKAGLQIWCIFQLVIGKRTFPNLSVEASVTLLLVHVKRMTNGKDQIPARA